MSTTNISRHYVAVLFILYLVLLDFVLGSLSNNWFPVLHHSKTFCVESKLHLVVQELGLVLL